MDPKWDRYKDLEDAFLYALEARTQDDYKWHQKNLLYATVRFLLKPYHDMLKEANEKQS